MVELVGNVDHLRSLICCVGTLDYWGSPLSVGSIKKGLEVAKFPVSHMLSVWPMVEVILASAIKVVFGTSASKESCRRHRWLSSHRIDELTYYIES